MSRARTPPAARNHRRTRRPFGFIGSRVIGAFELDRNAYETSVPVASRRCRSRAGDADSTESQRDDGLLAWKIGLGSLQDDASPHPGGYQRRLATEITLRMQGSVLARSSAVKE